MPEQQHKINYRMIAQAGAELYQAQKSLSYKAFKKNAWIENKFKNTKKQAKLHWKIHFSHD